MSPGNIPVSAAVATSVRRGLVVLILSSQAALAAGVALPDANKRVEDLDRLVGKTKAPDADLIAAVDAVGAALADLDPDADPVASARFRNRATDALLKALRLARVDRDTKRNLRNGVQLAAARALRHIDPDRADDLMAVLDRHVLADRGYDVDPSFYDAVLDPLVRLRAKGAFPWLSTKILNADPAWPGRNAAALDALLRLPCTGDQRRVAVNRILAIHQAFMFHIEDDFLELCGFRGTVRRFRFMNGPGPYWEAMRPTVMRAARVLATDPRTGLPAFDIDTKGEIGTLERFQVWYGQNGLSGRAPWLDGEPEPRRRDAVPYTRMHPPVWYVLGAPWSEAWRLHRRVLDRPLEAVAWRDEFRAKTLPAIAREALGDPAWEVRAAAAVTYARISAEGAAERMRERIDRDPSEPVREAAMLGLLLLADPNERDYLLAHAEDPAENPRLRGYALLALGFLKDAEPLRSMIASKESDDLRACAVRALGHAGGPASELVALLTDRRAPSALRAEAGTALLEVDDASVVPQVLTVFKEPVKGTPVAATSAAIALGIVAPDDARTIKRVAREMADTDEKFTGVRTLLAASASRWGGARGAEALAEEYENLRPNSMRYVERGHFLIALGRTASEPAKEILRKEIEALDHEWDLGACALGLALAGEHTALPRLRALLPESGDAYAAHGMMALALFSDPAGRPLIRDALARRRSDGVLEEGALALAMLDRDKAVPDLLTLWERARRPEHYDAFAWAFRLAASPDAIAPLQAMVEGKGRDPVQRAFALLALGRMADPAAPLHALARGSNPYAGNPTLLDLARWRDAAPLLD